MGVAVSHEQAAARPAASRPASPSEHDHPGLAAARSQAAALALPYAGAIDPQIAHDVLAAGEAVLVDVRTAEELKSIGSVPGSIHIAWQTGLHRLKNPRFLKDLVARVAPDAAVLFICRSGQRSAAAAAAAAGAGYGNAFNILEGFEGTGGEAGSGWRARGLPVRA